MQRRAGSITAWVALACVLVACGQDSPPPFDTRASEAIWCADDSGVVDTVTYAGHDGQLTAINFGVIDLDEGEVSEDDLVEACARGLLRVASSTLCEMYAPEQAVQRVAQDEHIRAVHGEPTENRPGFPVVISGEVICEQVQLHLSQAALPADRLRGWRSIDAFNRFRAVEGELARAADEGCLQIGQARELALTVRDELPGDWPVLEAAPGAEDEAHAGLCLDVRLERTGTLRVDYHAVETPTAPARNRAADE